MTFLPQFVSVSDPHAGGKLFFFGLGFIAITTALNALVILVAGRFVAAAKRNPRALRLFDYGFAALMSAFALRLVWAEVGWAGLMDLAHLSALPSSPPSRRLL